MKIDNLEAIIPKTFVISWDGDAGFGSFTLFKNGDTVVIDNECMSRETIKAVLCKLVDDAKLVDEEK